MSEDGRFKNLAINTENMEGYAEAMADVSVVADKINRSLAETAKAFKAFSDAVEDVYARSCPVCNSELVVIKEGKQMEDLREEDLLSIEGMRLVTMFEGVMCKYEVDYDSWKFVIHRHGIGYKVSWYCDDPSKGLTLIDCLTVPDVNGVVALLREALCNINQGGGSEYELVFKNERGGYAYV